ncbi:MAG: hypothetical protein WBL31_02460 [Ilumatobacteraceae bacterium]
MRTRLVTLTIASALVVAACSSDDSSSTAVDTTNPPPTTEPAAATTEAPVETAAPTTESAPETTEVALAEFQTLPVGPYDVGVTTLTINADTDRPLTLDVWFPIVDAGDAPLHRYTLIPGAVDTSDLAVVADPSAIADGPFPLVVYSHGSGGLRYIASNYTETIASHGYIVASADHSGNTALDQLLCTQDDGATIALNRVADVRSVIDEMLNPQNAATAAFVANVDPASIAVTGHSVGGFTTFASVSGYENDLGSVAADDRIRAIIPISPSIGGDRPPLDDDIDTTTTAPERVDPCADGDDASDRLTDEEREAARNRRSITDEQLASITVPAMILVGADDTSTPVEPNVTRAWEFLGSNPLHRVELVAGQHQSFTNACRYLELMPTLPEDLQTLALPLVSSWAAQGCGEGIMDIDRAFDLTNTFAINFLESVFRDAELITDTNTAMPDDVIYMSK